MKMKKLEQKTWNKDFKKNNINDMVKGDVIFCATGLLLEILQKGLRI